jgi:CRP/FNR family transcriptional regulator, cyclic AMP receptor protein
MGRGGMSDNEVDFSRLLGPGIPTRYFAKGDTIFREGERGDEFFVVVRGQAEIRSGNRCFETLGRNGIFGEMALIDDSPRSATVIALTDCTVAPIKENQFLFLVKHTPFFALSVMRVLAYRLRRQNKAVCQDGLEVDLSADRRSDTISGRRQFSGTRAQARADAFESSGRSQRRPGSNR